MRELTSGNEWVERLG